MFITASRSRWLPRLAGTLILALLLILATGLIAAAWIDSPTAGGSATDEGAGNDVEAPVLVVQMRPPLPSTPDHATPSPIGIADGYIPDGEVLSPFDVDHPAIANLDPALVAAVQDASLDARADRIELVVTSGWRSKRYQQALLDEAIITYGSEDEARKWVNTPDTSTHVTGDGVDIGYTDADYWLIEHGYRYGLCQTYANEIWHFELAAEPGAACPVPLEHADEDAP